MIRIVKDHNVVEAILIEIAQLLQWLDSDNHGAFAVEAVDGRGRYGGMPGIKAIRREKKHCLAELFTQLGLRPALIGMMVHKGWSFEHVVRLECQGLDRVGQYGSQGLVI